MDSQGIATGQDKIFDNDATEIGVNSSDTQIRYCSYQRRGVYDSNTDFLRDDFDCTSTWHSTSIEDVADCTQTPGKMSPAAEPSRNLLSATSLQRVWTASKLAQPSTTTPAADYCIHGTYVTGGTRSTAAARPELAILCKDPGTKHYLTCPHGPVCTLTLTRLSPTLRCHHTLT